MINVKLRLELKNVFPEEEHKEILEYLQLISSDTLLKVIGFFNTKPFPNYDNFFSNKQIALEIESRVSYFLHNEGYIEKPEVISSYSCLKLAEIILSKKELLLTQKRDRNVDEDELNLFKAFLVINEELNSRQVLNNLSDKNHEKLIDLLIIFHFPISDLSIYQNDYSEFMKLVYSTIIKVEYLFDFLKSRPELINLHDSLLESFSSKNENDFMFQMKYLFFILFNLKIENKFAFFPDKKMRLFLLSMISDDIKLDEDFTHIKNNPLYKIDEERYSIINHFFVIDKFYRSSKFKLKESYVKDSFYNSRFGDFFGFFNREFSEKYLMKNVLDNIFDKKYYIKKKDTKTEVDNEPDYYVRDGNTIFLFENKDVLVNKLVKSSANIETIEKMLKKKFLGDKKNVVGIGQLVYNIGQIVNKKFILDEYVNDKNSIKIYPILLVHDRIFQTMGINYKLNNWFIAELKRSLSKIYNPALVKCLTVIDIDSLIYLTPYFKEKNSNFKNYLSSHLKKMTKKVKINTPDIELGIGIANKLLEKKATPISQRKLTYVFPKKLLSDKFKQLVTNKPQ